MKSKFFVGLKYLLQFGFRPLAWYALYQFGLLTGRYKRLDRRPQTAVHRPSSTAHCLFHPPSPDQLSQTLGEEGKTLLFKEADEIVNGQVRVFGKLVPLDFTHPEPLRHWTEYETNHALISRFASLVPHSDIKFLWEPARFGWAFALGRAYRLTQDEKYAQAFWRHFESFTQANPANLGPHWMNGQEVAIRLMALVWCAHVFPNQSPNYQLLITSIHRHAARLPATLPYARSQNNNHLVTEAAAIYTAGLFFDNAKWRVLGWKWLNWAFQNQIGGYGEYIQHSANYHRLTLQTALWVNLIKREAFPAKTAQALGRSAHWLFSLLDNESGLTPNLGANDGALIFPLSSSAFEDYRPTVQAAARAFLRTGLPAGVWDEMSLWFGLKPAERVADSSAYLTDNLRGQNSWAYLRASHFKSRLSHIDQLHLDLWWRGLNVTQDAGTYLYNAPPPWDNPLATTRVHNTVTVDGRDQMTRAGRFLVLDWASAYSKNLIETDENILGRVRAFHCGYGSVKHERTVTVYRDERWTVEDKLTSPRRRPHTYRLHWLLPDWEHQLEETESTVRLRLKSPYGWITLSSFILHAKRSSFSVSLVRAGELIRGQREVLPYEGWVSRRYGQKVPALSLAFEVASEYNVTFSSDFTFPQ
ncbi:MAG: heparinase II/III family protein [Chloroflexi bacterium]|nr:heparinase II/III family protein [Chloroflexota bacterium]MCA2000249.1 heparinase II/III family protein [Chloroflexota bacterium]